MGKVANLFDISLLASITICSISYLYFKRPIWVEKIAPKRQEQPTAVYNARSLISKIETLAQDNVVVIIYGSQTGTAEDLAIRTSQSIHAKLGISTLVLDVEEYDMQEMLKWNNLHGKNWVLGFFMSTYGEGEPTDNASDFYNWIMNGKGLISDEGDQDDQMTIDQVFRGVNFFVFGLGNKTYEHYNAIADRLNKRLTKCGAEEICIIGKGDDEISMENDYVRWASVNLQSIAKHFGVRVMTENKSHKAIYKIDYVNSDNHYRGELSNSGIRTWTEKDQIYAEVVTNNSGKNDHVDYNIKHPYYSLCSQSMPLIKNTVDKFEFPSQIITLAETDKAVIDQKSIVIQRQCYHIEFDLGSSKIKYETGDHLGIWGNNRDSSVVRLAKLLKIKTLDAIIVISPISRETSEISIPSPSSIRHALTYYLDIESILKQHHFDILAHYAADSIAQSRLLSIAGDRDLYVKLIETGEVTLSDILEEYEINIPIVVALTQILRPIAVRYYSISSSALENPKKVTVTAVVVRYAIAQSHISNCDYKKVVVREGVTTSWLERLHEQSKQSFAVNSTTSPLHCPIYVRSSNFKLPALSVPIIMVGPGTGVAPFRAFVRERFYAASCGKSVGATWLFFGCRSENSDFLYSGEFKNMILQIKEKSLNIDLQIITAFSRDGQRKVYVQHKVIKHGDGIWDQLNSKRGYFYICGDAKHMAKAVNNALENVAGNCGKMSKDQSLKWVLNLRKEGRFLEDVWS